VEGKIQAFHSGLDTIRSFSDFGVAAALSLGMWVMIAFAYLETTLAFVASPQLAAMTPSEGVLLMIVSGGASVIQLPVLGWFTQIGLVAGAISKFFGVDLGAVRACLAEEGDRGKRARCRGDGALRRRFYAGSLRQRKAFGRKPLEKLVRER
jgi:hypothetical protein